jgi:hypothetical protein
MGERETGEDQERTVDGVEGPLRVRGRFARGVSGNPAGRPRGSRNRTAALCADLLSADAAPIFEKVIKMAKRGDAIALKLCVDRLLPVRAARDRAVELVLPAAECAADLVRAAAVVIDRAAAGDITLSEAKEFMALLEQQRRAIETSDLAVRIEALEASGVIAGGPPDTARRVRRILDERLMERPL